MTQGGALRIDLADGAKHRVVINAASRKCVSRRVIRVTVPSGLRGVRVTLGNQRLRVRHRRAVVDLRGKPAGVVRVVITGRKKSGRRVRDVRRFRTCAHQ